MMISSDVGDRRQASVPSCLRKDDLRCLSYVGFMFLIIPGLARLFTIYLQGNRSPDLNPLSAIINGTIQDATIALEFMSIFVLATHRRPWLNRPIAAIIMVFATAPIVFDVALQCEGFARLDIVNIRDFVRSFTAMFSSVCARLIKPGSIVIVAIFAITVYKLSDFFSRYFATIAITRSTQLIVIGAFFLSFQFSLLDGTRGNAYIYGNTIYTVQFGAFQAFQRTKVNQVVVSDPSDSIFASGELFTLLDPEEFPLWRETTGYTNEKLFDLSLNPDRRPNIIMMNMESWGYLLAGTSNDSNVVSLTPRFDSLMSKGIQYKSHFNPGLQTTNTLLSELLGVKPRFTHDPSMHEQAATLQGRSIANMLHDHDYETMFLSSVDLHWHNWHLFLGRHFDRVYGDAEANTVLRDAKRRCRRDCKGGWGLHDEWSLAAVEELIAQQTSSKPEQPFFMDYYSISTHDPYDAPISAEDESAIKSRLRGAYSDNDRRYMKTLKYADTQLGAFMDRMGQRGLLTNTIVIISGDHGPLHRAEQFHGFGAVGDKEALDPYSHVPFVIIPSEDLLPERYRGMKVNQVSSHVDIMSTIADFMQLFPLRHHSIGTSMQRKQQVDNRYVITDQPQPGRTSVSVITDSMKYEFQEGGACWAYSRVKSNVIGQPIACHGDVAIAKQSAEAHKWAKQLESITHNAYAKQAFMPTTVKVDEDM